jgi:ribosomal protein S12 methylthiotransferase
MEIIDVVNERDNICNYLDMPLQHASDRMLSAMKRQITRREMDDLVREIRRRSPDIRLRTTFIAGFPGETREDVEELKSFLTEHRFDRVGLFTYSHEEDTSAHGMEDSLSQEEKEERVQEIMEVQQEISYEKNLELVGKTLPVLIDRKEAGRYIGRTEYDSVEVDNEVVVVSDRRLPIGDFVNVRVTKAFDYDLEGVPY